MTDAPVALIWVITKSENANWSDVYIPINSPNAYGVEYDARDIHSLGKFETEETKTLREKTLNESIAPELFEGFQGWTRQYTDDNNSLIIKIYFTNVQLARDYNQKVIEIKKNTDQFNLESKNANWDGANFKIKIRKVEDYRNFVYYTAICNRYTGQPYPDFINY
jgi:hypothetical protein